jgi:hypothetical protein
MARFVLGQSQTTRTSAIVVDAGLPAGIHRFQLVVVNAAGVKSAPDQVLVQVQATTVLPDIRPTPLSPATPLQPLTPSPLRPRTPRRKGNPS